MEADPKQRSQRNRRRRRAAKMQQADRAAAAASDAAVSGEEDDENRHQKPPRPPTRKKRNKEPLMEEDIIDGFAILSFRSYEELENTIKNSEPRRSSPGALLTPQHPNSQAKSDNKCTAKVKHCNSPTHNNNKPASHKINNLLNSSNNNNNNNSVVNPVTVVGKGLGPASVNQQENGEHRTHEEAEVKGCCPDGDLSEDDGRPLAALQQATNGPLRQPPPTCRDHPLSDASSRCSSGRGYMCDSESEDDRGSDAGSDLFTAQTPKREACSPPSNSLNESPSVPAVGPITPTVVPAAATTNGPLTCRSPTPASAPTSAQQPLAIPSLIQNGPQHPASSEPPLLGSLPVPNGTATSTPSATPPEAASASLTVVNPSVVTGGPLVPPVVTTISSSSSNSSGNPPTPPLPINSSPAVVSHLFSPFQVEKAPLGLLGNSGGLSHPKGNSRGILSSSPPSTLSHSRPAAAPLSFQPHLNHTSNHLYNSSSNSSSSGSSKKASRPNNLPPTNSHTPPTGLPPPGLYSPLSPHPYQRTSPLLSSVPLKSTSVSSASSFPPLQLSVSPAVVPPSSVITHSSTRPHSSGALRVPSPAVVGTATTPTPSLGRDSSSSISSLSQLSQSLPCSSGSAHNNNNKDSNSSSGSSHSRSSSRNNTPCIIGPPPSSLSGAGVSLSTTTSATPCCTYSTPTYGGSSSLTSLVLTKPPWVSSSANPILGNVNSPHLTPPLPPRPTPPSPNPSSLPLPPSLHNNHHSSPFGPSPTGPPLHPGAPHPGMFAAPMPPPSALAASNLSLGPAAPPSHYSEALFSQPNQDFLRRELDTRFLASQDRSIAIPPPPYMRTEMHQHQHTHMHQHSPFLPPPLGNSLVPQANPHLVRNQRKLYDKFPKIDSPFYGRNALGLPSYSNLSPLLTPAGPAATSTPFTPAGHLAAFQPKMNSLVKSKNIKMGRWCAMHVRIAWEIYHHQQKQQQQQSDAHKAAAAAAAAASASSVAVPGGKSPADLLRPPGHLFPSLPRPHDLGPLSSSLLAAQAASSHSRTFDPSPHHNSFLAPNASHLGVPPFARPGYPGFGAPGSSFGGLGTLDGRLLNFVGMRGLTGSSLFGNRDLRASCLGPMGSVQDPLYQMHHRTPPSFPPSAGGPAAGAPPPPPSVVSVGGPGGASASWGGLKVEAERERLQREEHEREKQRKAELEKERREREKELEKSRELERERERREQERQKERDRESRVHHHAQEIIRNGDLLSGGRDREREWERSRERKEVSRSPHRSQQRDHLPGKNDSAFESSQQQQQLPSAVAPPHMLPKQEVKVKEERKEETEMNSRDHDRTRHDAHAEPSDYLNRPLPPVSLAMSLSSLDRSRMMRSLPVIGGGPPDRPPHSQVPPFWPPLPPPVPTSSAGNPVTNSAADPFHRAMDFHHHHAAVREQELQRLGLGPVMPQHHPRYRDSEFARHMVGEMDRHLMERERQVAAYERSKLAPPPLRPNEAPGFPGPLGTASSAALFPHLAGAVPHLNSLSSAPVRNKSGSPSTGIPPPLIPCSGSGSVVNNHVGGVGVPGQGASPTMHKLGLPPSSLLESEPFYAKERREMAALHPSEVDSQSR